MICGHFFLEALRMWESCWSHYQTDYFHLFICISIMAIYGDDIVQQDLGTDDMLLHFNSLAMHMSGQIVLKKVREPWLMNTQQVNILSTGTKFTL